MRGHVNLWFSIRARQNYHSETANDTLQGPGTPGWVEQEGGRVSSCQANLKTCSCFFLHRVNGAFEQKDILDVGSRFQLSLSLGCTFENEDCMKGIQSL